MLVVAVPLGAVMLSYTDTAAARDREAPFRGAVSAVTSIWCRRLQGARIAQVRVDTSVRKRQISFHVDLSELSAERSLHPARQRSPGRPRA